MALSAEVVATAAGMAAGNMQRRMLHRRASARLRCAKPPLGWPKARRVARSPASSAGNQPAKLRREPLVPKVLHIGAVPQELALARDDEDPPSDDSARQPAASRARKEACSISFTAQDTRMQLLRQPLPHVGMHRSKRLCHAPVS